MLNLLGLERGERLDRERLPLVSRRELSTGGGVACATSFRGDAVCAKGVGGAVLRTMRFYGDAACANPRACGHLLDGGHLLLQLEEVL